MYGSVSLRRKQKTGYEPLYVTFPQSMVAPSLAPSIPMPSQGKLHSTSKRLSPINKGLDRDMREGEIRIAWR